MVMKYAWKIASSRSFREKEKRRFRRVGKAYLVLLVIGVLFSDK